MTLLGQTREDLPFTVCDQFQPTVLEGQVCYSLHLDFINTSKSKIGKRQGILLVLDSGTFDLRKDVETESSYVKNIASLDLEASNGDESSARIYMNTLASFSDFRAGSYALSSLKKMTGTASFLKLSDDRKGCQSQAFEDCNARRYLEEVQQKCGCLPWAFSNASTVVRGYSVMTS